MLKGLIIGEGRDILATEDRELMKEAYRSEKKLLWLDLHEPMDDELAFLEQTFGFHPLSLKDCRIYTKNPKIDEFDHYLFIVTHVLMGDAEVEFPELDIFLSHKYLVTVHFSAIEELNRYWDKILQKLYDGPIHLDFVLYNVFDAVADSFHRKIEAIADEIEELEDGIMLGTIENAQPAISRIRRSLIFLRKQLTLETDMIEKLSRPDLEFFTKRSRDYLRDAMERFDHILHYAEVNRELMTVLADTYLTVLSNRMNEIFAQQNRVMQRLTVITAIFMPLTLLAGIYGMNFAHMPELNWHFGYYLVLLTMAALGYGLFKYFKKIGWLD